MLVNFLVNVYGWIGTVCILLAFWLVSTKRVNGDSVRYQLLNFFGSIGLLLNAWYYGAVPAVALDVAWIGIAGWGLYIMWVDRA